MAAREDIQGRLPARAGIGLRAPHVEEILATRPSIAWLEIHAENYMGGGPAVNALDRLRRDYPIAIHAVGVSLGTADGLDDRHLQRLRHLVERVQPAEVSEHLAWSVSAGRYLNHLLPLPYTEATLAIVARNVDRTQERLQRRILVENPSSYLRLRGSTIPEAEFLAEITRRTGCGVLLDVNNLHVVSRNLGVDAEGYLAALPSGTVGEIHLAGHSVNEADGREVLIDDHGAPVAPAVWRLYERALHRFAGVPTLVEWDTAVPALDVLLGEAAAADARLALADRREVALRAA